MPDIPYLSPAMRLIISQPLTWEQGDWFCGTKACLAGHMCLIAGAKPRNIGTATDTQWVAFYEDTDWEPGQLAQRLAGLYHWEACYLFNAYRTMPELYAAVNRLERGLAIESWQPTARYSDGGVWTLPDQGVVIARHRCTTWWRDANTPHRYDHSSTEAAAVWVATLTRRYDGLTYIPSDIVKATV